LSFQRGSLLRREALHPALRERVWAPFLRGEYETAVFVAYKEIEVQVRTAGRFASTDLGVPLMRRAFDVETGPLTDPSLPAGERQGMSDLFAGAVALLKNPSSHRHVSFTDPVEAAELIGTASYLLRVVDLRRSQRSS
jgi:uncharacterized protein (TIGR02391 family)